MTETTKLLKLMALDAEDLTVISAHMQDAVLKPAEIEWFAREKQLLLPVNRFAWESDGARRWLFKTYERRRSVLHFERVLGLRTKGIDKADKDAVLPLLSVTFAPATEVDDPSGQIMLTFSGGAQISAQVECIEARLTDLGGAWSTPARPKHHGDASKLAEDG